jgi:hypothetical protein
MRVSIVLAAMIATVTITVQGQDCAPVEQQFQLPTNTTNVCFYGDSAATVNSIAGAIDLWGTGCNSIGSSLPSLLAAPSNASVCDCFVDVYLDPNPSVTGDHADTYRQAYYPAPGAAATLASVTIVCYVQPCSPRLLAHEIGHALGLNDAPSTCSSDHIMSKPNSGLDFSDACTAAAAAWTIPSEQTGTPGTPGVPTTCHNCNTGGPEPLILDLNGDGIHTTDLNAPVFFDLDADGDADEITWTHPDTEEGILWLDLNHNRRVDDGSEIFGIGTTLPSGEKATNGFEALQVYDDPAHGGNGDGRISAGDRIFGRLRVWVDRNHDGVSQDDELTSIHALRIHELFVNYVVDQTPDAYGNEHRFRSVYSKTDPGNPRRMRRFALHGLVFRSR